ncbi:MAG: rod shape-determining protein MreD [Alphaproteobacteria bacterium]|nr:rod shape-determining protein MreD [Alphaproteobacteria bacterium]
MKPTFLHRLALFSRRLVPMEITILLLLISILPLRIPEYSLIKPAWVMISVFYWSIHRPDLFGQGSAFSAGLLLDLFEGSPLGVNALIFLMIYTLVLTQRRFFIGKPFGVSWWGFSMVAAAAMFGQWFLVSLIYGQITPIKIIAFSYLFTVGLYPVVGWICAKTQSSVLNEV